MRTGSTQSPSVCGGVPGTGRRRHHSSDDSGGLLVCGIAGMIGNPDQAVVERMAATLRHRGPDATAVVTGSNVSLGHTRLAVIDLSDSASQPMADRSGRVRIVFNGEIYNYRQLRRDLQQQGVQFQSASDTEVVLESYLLSGPRFVRQLRGIFAFAIHDAREDSSRPTVLLARDHLGVKPLLYAGNSKQLVFASELKAILPALPQAARVDPVALRQLLAWGSVCQPRTMIAGVSMLPAGHTLLVHDGEIGIERFWEPGLDRVPEARELPYPEIVRRVRDGVMDAVTAQLVADVPVGAFLSGGIDSALLVAMMKMAVGDVRTFSVGFDARGVHDESADAHVISQHLGTRHTSTVVTGSEVARDLPAIVRSLDQPSVDGVNAWYVAQAARSEVTVALSGTGGDELFAGYPWYRALEQRPSGPADRLRGIHRWGVGRRHFVRRYADQYSIFGAEADSMLSPECRIEAGETDAYLDLGAHDELADGTAIERTTAITLGNYTRNQLLRDIDATSMAHSLEVRVPFLDVPLLDLALSIPDDAKRDPTAIGGASYTDSGIKRVLLDVGRDLLPDDFANRSKRGFTLPFDAWLHGPLSDNLTGALAPETVARRGLMNPERATQLHDDFVAGRIGWTRPWLLMNIELWCQAFLDDK